MRNKKIIITGGTGAFGRLIVEKLLKTQVDLTLLIRAGSQKEAESRAHNTFNNLKTESKISVFNCDLTSNNLGLMRNQYLRLIDETTHILHAAASTRFTLPLEEARRNNVVTTNNMLFFAKSCKRLERFGFVSTAYVAGKRSGIIKENEFKHDQGFLNTYEQSKYEAEELVRKEKGKPPLVIFRPSLTITPFRKSGRNPINALTLGLFLVHKGLLPILPGDKDNKLDIIKAEVASQTIARLFLKNKLLHVTYHITSANNAPKIEDLALFIEERTGKKLSIRFCGNVEQFNRELKKITRFRPDLAIIYQKIHSFLPELAFPKHFDNHNLLEELTLNSFSKQPITALQAITFNERR